MGTYFADPSWQAGPARNLRSSRSWGAVLFLPAFSVGPHLVSTSQRRAAAPKSHTHLGGLLRLRRQWAKQFAPALFVVLPPRFGVGGCLAGVSQRQVAAPHLAGSPPLYVCAGAAAFLAARVGAVNRAPLAAFFARGDATSTLLRRLSRKGGSPHPFGL